MNAAAVASIRPIALGVCMKKRKKPKNLKEALKIIGQLDSETERLAYFLEQFGKIDWEAVWDEYDNWRLRQEIITGVQSRLKIQEIVGGQLCAMRLSQYSR